MNATNERVSTVDILILEDDPVHRMLLEAEFKGDSYSRKCAADAAQALELMQSEGASYQIGILDLKVPAAASDFPQIEPALRVIEEARKLFPKMIIIAISSIFITEEIKARLDAVGTKRVFLKPFPIEDLHDFVDSLRPIALG
jgi:DNA-binding response OmpR family regulator